MDLDGDLTIDAPRELRGFRRRWNTSQASSPDLSGPLAAEPFGEGPNLPYEFDPDDIFLGDGGDELPQDVWDVISMPEDDTHAELFGVSNKRLFDSLDVALQPAPIQLLDPQKRESAWKAAAIEADFKRLRSTITKLPWEQEGFAFKPVDKWQGTMLEAFDKRFAPVFIGVHDVLGSQVVQSRPNSVSLQRDLPVVPISLKRARKEQLDEDIRRKALLRFRDLILQDPLATQLGTSLHGHVQQGGLDDEIDQSFRDSFRMKASATLQKRAASLWKLARFLREIGQLHPLRLSEAQLYVTLCRMRDSGSGATSAQHVIEALHFLDAIAKLTVVDLSEVVSSRCRGVARDLYLTKDPLRQKVPLTVEQVRKLEMSMQTAGSVFRCILGQILSCIHACCRWKDAQHLKSITTESGHGETLLYADALTSKTAVTLEARTRFLPYAAIGSGISMVDWAHLWLEARDLEGLTCAGCVLPSYSEKQACWLETPMSASEATAWLRDFLEGTQVSDQNRWVHIPARRPYSPGLADASR